MKHEIATNPSQSQRLIACGVDLKSAAFVWMENKPNNPRLTLRTEIIEDNNPYILAFAWSLSALLALLPMEIRKDGIDFTMELKPYPHDEECCRWCISYYDSELEATAYYSEAPDPIEACVQMTEWLVDNGCKLNEIE